MTRNKFELDRIAVASPCSVAWDEMEGDDRVRFCDRCSLNVYNISAMTKAEAESVITNTEGRVCARFYRRADGTILTQDCPVGSAGGAEKGFARGCGGLLSARQPVWGPVTFRSTTTEGRIKIRCSEIDQEVWTGSR